MQQEETTNAVLREKITGLTDLTAERFRGIQEALTRIETVNASYATKAELEEVKKDFVKQITDINLKFTQHNEDDKESFGFLSRQMSTVTKTIYIGMGGWAVALFVIQYVIPIVLKKQGL